MKLVLLGAPGCGKGTQALKIAEKFHIPHISTGEIFRDNIKRKTPLGVKIKESMDAGRFCSDDDTIEIVKERLSEDDCKNGYILDGFPRTLYQAEMLEKIDSPDKAIEIKLDFDIIERRITGRRCCSECGMIYHVDFLNGKTVCEKCGAPLIIRKDDTKEVLKDRLSTYCEKTLPLVDFYKNLNKLYSIDANSDDVFNKIMKVLL